MKLKLTLATVVFAPTIVMAQAMVTDKPVIAPPEVVKEPVIKRPGENGAGVYKPATPQVKPATPQVSWGDALSKGQAKSDSVRCVKGC